MDLTANKTIEVNFEHSFEEDWKEIFEDLERLKRKSSVKNNWRC